ncbi:MAG TPA: signal peptidase II [Rectinemataceae bacterium]|nr:signal peptidase II [Rectinemataceae bacterium]
MEQNVATTDRKGGRIAMAALVPIVIVAADQLTKAWIAGNVPQNTIASRHMGDFLWIVHTRNLGIAFSIGDSASRLLRIALFIVLPACFMSAASVYCFVSKKLSLIQRYAIAFIIGGGLGNLIDRIFRPEGVVDFISFSLFGIFGLDRFPTFNIADSSVTIGAAILLISGFLMEEKEKNNE